MAEPTGYSHYVRDCEVVAIDVMLRRTLNGFSSLQLMIDGGTDGIRTRDLLRDRQAC